MTRSTFAIVTVDMEKNLHTELEAVVSLQPVEADDLPPWTCFCWMFPLFTPVFSLHRRLVLLKWDCPVFCIILQLYVYL